MTIEEVDKIIADITQKIDNKGILTDFENLVMEEVQLAKKEKREISIRLIEDFKFWMD